MTKYKINIFMVILFMLVNLLCGCNSMNKISQLKEKISDIEYEISSVESELDDWENLYDEAKSTYDQYKYSDSHSIQQELEKTKSVMDEADKKVAEFQREISLLETHKKLYEEQIERLEN